MRATKISVAVIAAIVMGTTPGSSLDAPGTATPHDVLRCTASGKNMISLVGGASRIALISPDRCNN